MVVGSFHVSTIYSSKLWRWEVCYVARVFWGEDT